MAASKRSACIACSNASQARALRHIAALPAIEAGDLVALLQEQAHDTRADVTGSADDTNSHNYSSLVEIPVV
jgi:hypothetical protein